MHGYLAVPTSRWVCVVYALSSPTLCPVQIVVIGEEKTVRIDRAHYVPSNLQQDPESHQRAYQAAQGAVDALLDDDAYAQVRGEMYREMGEALEDVSAEVLLGLHEWHGRQGDQANQATRVVATVGAIFARAWGKVLGAKGLVPNKTGDPVAADTAFLDAEELLAGRHDMNRQANLIV